MVGFVKYIHTQSHKVLLKSKKVQFRPKLLVIYGGFGGKFIQINPYLGGGGVIGWNMVKFFDFSNPP